MNRSLMILAGCLVLVLAGISFGAYSGGEGSAGNPYKIGSVSDWQTLMSSSGDWNKYFVMTADVNLAGVNVTPVGNSGIRFTGIFDGDDHVISNAVINMPSSDGVGLFGYAHGQIKNLGVEDVNIIGKKVVGGLVGDNYSNYIYSGVIANCYTSGFVNGVSAVGGLVGINSGDLYPSVIRYCYSSCSVSASNTDVGGLAGYNRGTISDCYATGSVSLSSTSLPSAYAGGLVGNNYGGTISNCYASGSVSSNLGCIGGLVGNNYSSSTIMNCYASGSVSSSSGASVGGLVGSNGGNVTYCYSSGAVSSPYRSGGLLGYGSTGKIFYCFWDTESSGQSNGIYSGNFSGAVGKTTEEMKTISTFADAGWSIADVNGPDRDWIMPENDYPKISSLYWISCGEVPFLGDGTEGNPYQIWTADDFVALGNYGFTWNKHIQLMADIDLTGVVIYPIGNSFKRFTGSFDGQGFSISNATMDLPEKDNVGLFGWVGKDGVVVDLKIEDVNIVGKKVVGGLAGYNYGEISDCNVIGDVRASACSSFVGGVAGFNFRSSISGCCSNVRLSGLGSTIGGLAGVNGVGSTISNCRAAGEIVDVDPNGVGSFAGGLVGYNSMGTICRSCSAVDISINSSSTTACSGMGGLAGSNNGEISKCYSSGNISATSLMATVSAGGLIGVDSLGDVNDSYATGDVSFDCHVNVKSAYFVGGVAGLNYESLISRCYANGVIGSGESAEYDVCVGGVTGLNMEGEVRGCFWDVQASGKTTSGGGKGLTSEQMKTKLIYQMAGWGDSGWAINDGVNSPRLCWENSGGGDIGANSAVPFAGSGSEADPYQIWSAADFAYLSWYSCILDKHIALMDDIDMAGIQVYPIGDLGAFTGRFDGMGHAIKNVEILEPTNSFVGLFSHVGSGGVITGLGIEDANIVGGDVVGALIGKNQGGEVGECYSTGRVDGFTCVGGLIGKNESVMVSEFDSIGGEVSSCYSIANVTIWDFDSSACYAGGLLGGNSLGRISNCYARGNVCVPSTSFRCYIGGLIGYNLSKSSSIKYCYASGFVSSSSLSPAIMPYNYSYSGGLSGFSKSTSSSGSFYRCFWDTETSGQAIGVGELSSDGTTGKATVGMKSQSTYGGWNFTTPIWKICNRTNYPKLAWQKALPGDFVCPDGVDYLDFSVLAAAWYSQDGDINWDVRCDISGPNDSVINELDLAELAENWLSGI